MIKKRNIYLAVIIILLFTALFLVFQIRFLRNRNVKNENIINRSKAEDKFISEKQYKYCDIVKIVSKYDIKIQKLLFKNNSWNIIGNITDNLNNVNKSINLLKEEKMTFYIKDIKGNNKNISVGLEIEIK